METRIAVPGGTSHCTFTEGREELIGQLVRGHRKRKKKGIGIQCYFADPYASWQRGSNEQVNGMVRRYLPKGTDFSKITDEQVAWVESRINNRPRKCLGYKTSLEVASAFVALAL